MIQFKKIEIISATAIVVAFFLPWVSFGGLFSFSGRITAFAGPLLVGTVTYLHSQRLGLLSVSFFFVFGFLLMLMVKNV